MQKPLKSQISFLTASRAFLIGLTVSIPAIAVAGGSLTLQVGAGSSDYETFGSNLDLWSENGKWAGGIGFYESNSEGGTESKGRSAYLNYSLIKPGVTIGINAAEDELDLDIDSIGASISIDLSKRFQWAQTTELELNATRTTYNRVRQDTYRHEFGVGINHAISESWWINISFSNYSYDPNPAELRTAFIRTGRNPSIAQQLLGLIDDRWAASVSHYFDNGSDVFIELSHTSNIFTVFGDHTQYLTIEYRHPISQNWFLSIAGSHIRPDDDKNANSYTTSISYNF